MLKKVTIIQLLYIFSQDQLPHFNKSHPTLSIDSICVTEKHAIKLIEGFFFWPTNGCIALCFTRAEEEQRIPQLSPDNFDLSSE